MTTKPNSGTVSVSRELRSVLAMVLNALDRDAEDGKAIRGEMASELRSLLAQPADQQGKVCDCNQGRLPCTCKEPLADLEEQPYAYGYEHDGMVHNEIHPPVLTVSRWPEVKEPFTEVALYSRPQCATAKVDEIEEFEKWFSDHIKDWPDYTDAIKKIAYDAYLTVWQARAKLNGGQS